jgi:N-acyl-D-aspartate/D-glutamate deacylase
VLSSDYFLQPRPRDVLVGGEGGIGLPRAVAMVSANPAAVAGLDDHGVIAEGKRADLVHIHLHGPCRWSAPYGGPAAAWCERRRGRWRAARGTLVLVVGPSGAGKIPLIAWCRHRLAGRPRSSFRAGS